MDILNTILTAIQAIAPTVASTIIPGSGPLLHDLMRAVSGSSPETPIEQVAQQLATSPEQMVALQQLAMQHEVSLAQIEVQKLAVVNATMQTESKSEHWPQWSWRPFNGYLFGLAVVLIYFVLPAMGRSVPAVPEWIWMGWAGILGVATWDRGKAKRAMAGDQADGLLASAIKAIKG
jgi:hypothetical protein